MTEVRARSAYLRLATRRSTPPRPVVPTIPDHHHGEQPHRPLTRIIDRARRHRPAETQAGTAPKQDTPTQRREPLDTAASHQCANFVTTSHSTFALSVVGQRGW